MVKRTLCWRTYETVHYLHCDRFRKYGADFVACIWIRKVDGANNTDARFAAAFENVPSNKIRLYTDDEIPSLQDIDIPNGEC
jgi:hypothetical protein